MAARLAENNYGKSRVRMVRVLRHPDRHELQDLNLRISFEGDFEAAHTSGDNSLILPTDTMKNTVYALAREKSAPEEPEEPEEIEQIEDFAARLTAHFLAQNPQVSRVTIEIDERRWERISINGEPHPHAFIKSGDEKRTTRVSATRELTRIESGIEDLILLKTTGSGFSGFLEDRFTTLKPTSDRILATAVKASWLYAGPVAGYGSLWQGVRQTIIETFALHDSLSVQQTLYAIGEAALARFEPLAEISLSLPNRHCLLVDLSPFGFENDNEIFLPVDEPHGLIEARIVRACPEV